MPLLWLSLAFLAGVFLAAGQPQTTWTWLGLAGAAFGLAILQPLAKRLAPIGWVNKLSIPTLPQQLKLPVPLFVLIGFIFLGSSRYQAAQPAVTPDFIAYYLSSDPSQPAVLTVEGYIAEPPDVRDTYTGLTIEAEQVWDKKGAAIYTVHGRLLAKTPPGETWRYGDRVNLSGVLQAPPENADFSYRDFLARQGVYAYMPAPGVQRLAGIQGSPFLRALYDFRQRCVDLVYRLYPDPEASLLAGILLGVDSGIPQAVQDAFKASGTAHIIAISGQDFAILHPGRRSSLAQCLIIEPIVNQTKPGNHKWGQHQFRDLLTDKGLL